MEIASSYGEAVTFTGYSRANPETFGFTASGGSMSNQDSLEYFRRRERAERAAAKQAASEAARRIHQELAQGYAERLRNA